MPFPKQVLFFALCGALTALCPAEETTIRLRADQWMPFNGTPTAEKPGYVIEIVRAVFGSRGIAIDYETMPWEETLKAVRAGTIEGAIGANESEAAELARGEEPVGIPKIGLFTLKESSFRYENLQSLNPAKLGAIAGYSYWEAFDRYISAHLDKNVTLFKGETPLADAIGKLNNKEIDVMPETLAVFVWALKSQGHSFTDYRIAYLHEGVPVFVAFTNNEQGRKFAKILDEGLREMRTNKELAKILSNYGIEDWKE